MATVAKNYLDLTGLQSYDTLIKTYVDTGDAKAIKTVLWDSTNEQIKFYKKENATLSDTADYSVEISSQDVESLKTRVGMSSTLNGYNSATNLTDIMNVLTGSDSTTGSVAKAAADAVSTAEGYTDTKIEALDADLDASGTAQHSGTFVVSGVTEVNGVITAVDSVEVENAGAVAALDAQLATVAKSGEADDVSTTAITDGAAENPETLYAAGDVQGVLTSIARDLNDLETESVVTVEQQAQAETGYASTYVVKQNGTQVGAKINIPKDFLVKSAEIKTVTVADEPYEGAEVGDKYIDFVINAKDASATAEHIYLPVNELVDVYTAEAGATQVQLAIDSSNEISATIVAGSIGTTELANDAVTTVKIADDAVTADKVSISGHSETQTAGTDGLALSVTTTDGQVSAVSGSIAANTYDAYGAAAAAVAALDGSAGIASVSGDVITIKGGVTEADGVVSNSSADDVTISPIATASINALFS